MPRVPKRVTSAGSRAGAARTGTGREQRHRAGQQMMRRIPQLFYREDPRPASEEEARRILRDALVRVSQPQPLGQRLKQRFAEVADADFELPSRQISRTPPNWDDTP